MFELTSIHVVNIYSGNVSAPTTPPTTHRGITTVDVTQNPTQINSQATLSIVAPSCSQPRHHNNNNNTQRSAAGIIRIGDLSGRYQRRYFVYFSIKRCL